MDSPPFRIEGIEEAIKSVNSTLPIDDTDDFPGLGVDEDVV